MKHNMSMLLVPVTQPELHEEQVQEHTFQSLVKVKKTRFSLAPLKQKQSALLQMKQL